MTTFRNMLPPALDLYLVSLDAERKGYP